MNSIHDLGGMQGFGPVGPEDEEPAFHMDWEGRVLGLQRSILSLGLWNIDVFRHAQEKIRPIDYLSWSYYERWMRTLTATALERGIFDEEELRTGKGLSDGSLIVQKKLTMKDINKAFLRGNFERIGDSEPEFSIGNLVVTKQTYTTGHTRLPRYARDKLGTVIAIRGRHVFPDSVVDQESEDPQWLYTVEFEGCELWGEAVDPTVSNLIDAFEPYLSRP